MEERRLASEESVIVPTFNRAGLLRRCLQSIWDQSVRPREVLVIDDGSTDDTQEVVERFRDESDSCTELRFWHQANRGVSSARNYGLEQATSRTISFLDSDDAWEPLHVEKAAAIFEARPDVGVVLGRYALEDEAGVLDEEESRRKMERNAYLTRVGERVSDSAYVLDAGVAKRHLIRGDFGFLLSATSVRTDRLAHKVFFEEGLTFAEDIDFMARLLSQCREIAFLDEPVVRYYLHGKNTVLAQEDTEKELTNLRSLLQVELRMLALCDTHEDYRGQLASVANRFRRIGWILEDQGDLDGALEAFQNSACFSRRLKDRLRPLVRRLRSLA